MQKYLDVIAAVAFHGMQAMVIAMTKITIVGAALTRVIAAAIVVSCISTVIAKIVRAFTLNQSQLAPVTGREGVYLLRTKGMAIATMKITTADVIGILVIVVVQLVSKSKTSTARIACAWTQTIQLN